MPDKRLHVPLAGMLLCLFAPCGCEQPQSPDPAADSPPRQEPAILPEPPVMPSQPPAAAPATQPDAERVAPPAGKTVDLESLLLKPQDKPFAEATTHSFGEIPEPDWLAAPPRRPGKARLLPDLFDDTADQDRVNVEGELLLDGSQGTSRMVDGVGIKVEVSTND